jgi:pimeloyl-ACP methyl ester carboxylesterase
MHSQTPRLLPAPMARSISLLGTLRRSYLGLTLCVLGVSGGIAGCTDSTGRAGTPGVTGVSALIVPNEDPGSPQDPNIRTNDTYAVAIVQSKEREVTYPGAEVLNPATLALDNVVDATSPVTAYRYEIGYDSYGRQVAAQRLTPSDTADGGTAGEAVNIAFVGGTTVETDIYGAAVPVQPSEESAMTDQFRAGVGDVSTLPPLVDGFQQAAATSFMTRASLSASAVAASAPLSPGEEIATIPLIPPGTTVVERTPGVVEVTAMSTLANGIREKRSVFALKGRMWELQSMHTAEHYDVSGRRGYREVDATVKSLRIRRNPTKDALRVHSARLLVSADQVLFSLPVPPRSTLIVPDEPPTGPPAAPVCDFGATRNAAGPRISLNHGILSDCGTWRGYGQDLWARGTNLRAMQVVTTGSTRSYQEQANSWLAQILNRQAGAYVIVGHSNGGIVGRKVAQLWGASRVSGIITLNSPHGGASITTWNRQLAFGTTFAQTSDAAFNTISFIIGSPVIGTIGGQISGAVGPAALFGAAGLGTKLLQDRQDVFAEMKPGIYAASGMNIPGAEPYQPARYAFYSETPRKWLSVRLACDFLPGKEGETCVKNMKRASRFAFITAFVGTVAGIAGFAPGFAIAAYAGGWLAKMVALDLVFKWMVDGNTSGDGIVSSYSQRSMPATIQTTRIPGDPSHLRATTSRAAKGLIEQRLRLSFGANIQQIP